MALADTTGIPDPDLRTDAGKNQHAANIIAYKASRLVRDARRFVEGLNETASKAPGSKATIEALLGADESELATLVTAILTIANGRKRAADPNLTYDGTWDG